MRIPGHETPFLHNIVFLADTPNKARDNATIRGRFLLRISRLRASTGTPCSLTDSASVPMGPFRCLTSLR
jgi:hypothetical protein